MSRCKLCAFVDASDKYCPHRPKPYTHCPNRLTAYSHDDGEVLTVVYRCGCKDVDGSETRCEAHPPPDPDAGARAACEAYGEFDWDNENEYWRGQWRAVAEAVRKADKG